MSTSLSREPAPAAHSPRSSSTKARAPHATLKELGTYFLLGTYFFDRIAPGRGWVSSPPFFSLLRHPRRPDRGGPLPGLENHSCIAEASGPGLNPERLQKWYLDVQDLPIHSISTFRFLRLRKAVFRLRSNATCPFTPLRRPAARALVRRVARFMGHLLTEYIPYQQFKSIGAGCKRHRGAFASGFLGPAQPAPNVFFWDMCLNWRSQQLIYRHLLRSRGRVLP